VHDSRSSDVMEQPWSSSGIAQRQGSDERSKEAGASGHDTAATEKQRERVTCGAWPTKKLNPISQCFDFDLIQTLPYNGRKF
jgi:hypothetical protein